MIGKRFASDDEVLGRLRRLEHRVNSIQIGPSNTITNNIVAEPTQNFVELLDVPQTYAAAGNFVARVKSTVDQLEFAELKGTTNRVTVTPHAADFVLSLPQDYHTAATPTLAGLYLKSSSIAPFLKMTNESDTERDPIIQFSVGATPEIKWTNGVDDSDDDRWKLAVGDEFGSDHDTIVVTSGDGLGPPVAEWTLIDSYPTPLGAGSTEDPYGICSDGTYLYYSEGGSDGVEYIFRLVKIDPIAETEICRSAVDGQGGPPWWNGFMFRQCATDGTHVYVGLADPGTIRKYLCSDLSYDSETAWIGQYDFTMCYWNGYLYVSGAYTAYNNYVLKIRCSDMTVIWTRSFPVGSGVGEMNYAQGIATDGTNLCIGDFYAGGNNRLIRLDMDGVWVDATVVANTMGLTNKALWYAGNYLYNYATYTGVDRIEKRNKADLSIAETFLSLTASQAIQGCQSGDFHYIAERNDNRISKYQYTSGGATIPSAIQFRLKDAADVFHDIAKLTPEIRFGVGTTTPTETIEAVGNIKATGGQFISTIATGTTPITVNSITVSPNLNAGLVDGFHHDQSLLTTASPTHPTMNLSATSNQIVLQSAGVTGTITATPTSSNKTWTLQDFTGTIYQTDGTDVAVADGGTNKSAWTLYAIPYASDVTTIGEIAIGTAGQVLAVNGGANGYTWIAAGGALALDDLTDVDAAAPNEEDVLTWDSGTSTWIAAPGGGGTLALDDLTDVDAAAPSDDDIIRFDTASGLWKNEALPAGGAHVLLSATHTDTTAAGPTAGDIIYADATPKWTKRAKGTDGHVLTLVSGFPNWAAPTGGGGAFSATGGTITYDGLYTIHTFTSSGTFSVTSGVAMVQVLVVGGGGGGGAIPSGQAGGGAGGGGVLETYRACTVFDFPVVVGDGGVNATSNGGNSSFLDVVAYGGGKGGAVSGGIGWDGASGGGGGNTQTGYGAGILGQGYHGGGGNGAWENAGGGGGAGAIGGTGTTNVGGNGGAGKSSSISGTPTYYGGGGGGWGNSTGGTGGTGGGGNGGAGSPQSGSTDGTDGLGGGAGSEATGGKGVVIIRYLT